MVHKKKVRNLKLNKEMKHLQIIGNIVFFLIKYLEMILIHI